MTKHIFVTGGVVSGLGKGITAASLGRLLKARGLKVAAQKLDPYINVDPRYSPLRSLFSTFQKTFPEVRLENLLRLSSMNLS